MAKKQYASREQLVQLLAHCLVAGNFAPMTILADRFSPEMVKFGKTRNCHSWDFPVRGGSYRLSSATGTFSFTAKNGDISKYIDPIVALYWVGLGYNAPTVKDLQANAEVLEAPNA